MKSVARCRYQRNLAVVLTFTLMGLIGSAEQAFARGGGLEKQGRQDAGRAPASLVSSARLRSPVSLAPSWYTDPRALGTGASAKAATTRTGVLGKDLKQVNVSDSFRRRLYFDPSQ